MKIKLNNKDLDKLKTLAAVKQDIILKEGKRQHTKGGIYLETELDVDVPKEVGIINLRSFLSCIELFGDNVEIDFTEDTHASIVNGNKTLKYAFTNKTFINPPKGFSESVQQTARHNFKISEELLSEINTILKVQTLPHVVFGVDEGSFSINVCNLDNASETSLNVTVDEIDCDDFRMVIEADKFITIPNKGYDIELGQSLVKMVSDDYTIIAGLLAKFSK